MLELKKSASGQTHDLDASRFGVLSRLADDLAHEIKNPLHAIVINLEVLRKRVERGDSASALQRAEVVEHELHRVHELIEALLKLLRPRKEGAGPHSVAEAMGGVLQLVAVRAKLAGVEYQEDALPVDAYTMVTPDAIRFATLAISEEAIETARAGRGVLAVRTSLSSDALLVTVTANAAQVGVTTPYGALELANELLAPQGAGVETNADGSVTFRLPLVTTLT